MTQITALNKELMKISKDVTTQDKKDCMVHANVHLNTIVNYLNGQGKDADLCAKMISFYKQKIESRNQVLG